MADDKIVAIMMTFYDAVKTHYRTRAECPHIICMSYGLKKKHLFASEYTRLHLPKAFCVKYMQWNFSNARTPLGPTQVS